MLCFPLKLTSGKFNLIYSFPDQLRHNMFKKAILFIACGFGTGFAPFAPGTFGSLLGILAYFIIQLFNWQIQIILVAALIIIAVITSHMAAKVLQKQDPGSIVIDEIAGQVITLWGVEFTLINVIAGFILFRFFDIIKPYPIKKLEKRVPGGAGIVVDDLLAGVYARIIMLLFLIVYNYIA